MSKTLLGAAVAALSLTACQDPPPPPRTVVATLEPRTVIVAPVTPPRDAGAPLSVLPEVTPLDPLVVAHDSPNVDHLRRARSLQEEGDLTGALHEARRALYTTPADVETLTLVGALSRKTGQSALAADAYQRLASLQRDDPAPLILRARACLQANQFDDAIEATREALRRDSESVEAFQVMGLAQLKANELSGAIASFEHAIALHPRHGWAHNNLGLAYLRANENQKAVEVLTVAAEVLPNVAFVHNNLGIALERVGRADDATVAYQHAMDLSPKYVKARVNAARVAKALVDEVLEQDGPSPDTHPLPVEE